MKHLAREAKTSIYKTYRFSGILLHPHAHLGKVKKDLRW